MVAIYNRRGTAGGWVNEGKNAIIWTRLSCYGLRADAGRLQLHTPANNLANVLGTFALPARGFVLQTGAHEGYAKAWNSSRMGNVGLS